MVRPASAGRRPRFAGCYVVDPSYIGGIVETIKADGLSVSLTERQKAAQRCIGFLSQAAPRFRARRAPAACRGDQPGRGRPGALLHVARARNCNTQQPGSLQVASPLQRAAQQRNKTPASHRGRELFCFSAPADPANEVEALHERAAILAVEATQDAARASSGGALRCQSENRWRALLRNAQRVPRGSRGRAVRPHRRYQAAAARRGDVLAHEMAQSLRLWIERMVH